MAQNRLEELAFIITGDLLDQSEHWLRDEKTFMLSFLKCIQSTEGKDFVSYLLNEDVNKYLDELNVRRT